ncbi:MAG: tetratricopeptide repeat protein [Candidatus Thiodiazotropha sp. (ex Dulcina madagascariensis)]|nr:tetratricopeptide repeat protein [Candidatus Thiodiazotropha sp. (ex Dulcina madagascariensis)]MCU7925852.1 tetratricopeptide repeat protein [Candidatus Thiodiazotropha sp. (ex Dulcina madagascariensis)]
MMEHINRLEPDELMHLALHASNNNRPDEAISLLKDLINKTPYNAEALYLLGALHAEIGMYDRAKEEISKALEYEPNLVPARFQLGLLHLTSGNVDLAEKTWSDLEELGEKDCFFLFKRGLLSLAQDRFDSCIEDLSRGIALNSFNEPLNKDMSRIIEAAEKTINEQSVTQDVTDDSGDSTNNRFSLLSAYRRNDIE